MYRSKPIPFTLLEVVFAVSVLIKDFGVSESDFLSVTSADRVGLRVDGWDRTRQLAQQLVADDVLPAVSYQFQTVQHATPVEHFGSAKLQAQVPVTDNTLYLVASLTKPIVAMGVLLLVERGLLALNQRVVTILPQFKEASKRSITIRNLLTHTSGLPDMLSNNQELREQNSTLADFVAHTTQAELLFSPGRGAQYQSMGYGLLGPIIDVVAGMPYQDFFREELFQPLGMENTWLGLTAEQYQHANVAEVRVPEVQEEGDHWNWNSKYWQTLGAPWGGLLSTVSDLSRFCRTLLKGGVTPQGSQLFHPNTIALATTNRLDDYPNIPEHDRRSRGWGCGWRMNWVDHRGAFGDLLGASTYGHWGATGTLFWIDPTTQSAFVALSTEPMSREVSPLVNLSNSVVASRNR